MKFFNLTDKHIKLLRSSYIEFDDNMYCGSAQINVKRPYGNSDVNEDLFRILEPEIFEKYNGDMYEIENSDEYDTISKKLFKIHRETATALQIILRFGEFKPGLFFQDEYSIEWEKFEGSKEEAEKLIQKKKELQKEKLIQRKKDHINALKNSLHRQKNEFEREIMNTENHIKYLESLEPEDIFEI